MVSFAWVRGRPPRPIRHGQPRSRTAADAGERWSALLESVLGATPREFESRILRHADLLRRAWVTFARCAMSHGACLIFCLSLGPGHMPYSGQIGVAARGHDTRWTWSGVSRTYLTGSVRAAEACAPPFGAGRDRPPTWGAGCCCVRPDAAKLQTASHYREVRGERAGLP